MAETSAREFAHKEFQKPTSRKVTHYAIPLSPWPNPERVRVIIDTEYSFPGVVDGLVEVPDQDGRYPSHDAEGAVTSNGAAVTDEPGPPAGGRGNLALPRIKIKGTGAGVEPEGSHLTLRGIQIDGRSEGVTVGAKLSASAKGVATIDARVIRAITPEVVSRAIANKEILAYQVRSLLAFLDDVLEPKSGSNMGPPQLWALGIEDDKDAELSEQITQLRGELGQVLAVLESAEPEKEAVSTALTELQKVGWLFLKTVAVLAATGTGLLLMTSVAGLLDSAGIVPWGDFIELTKAFRG